MRLRKSSFPNSFCNHFLTKTSRKMESGAFRKAFSFTVYGLKSSALTGLFFFGSRIRLTMSAIRLAVCSHSKRPRASARAASSRSVRGSGLTPAIPARRRMRSSIDRGPDRFFRRMPDPREVPSAPACFAPRSGGSRRGSSGTPFASPRGKNR